MDITWDEFQHVAPHLDEVTQLRVMNAVLALRLQRERQLTRELELRLSDQTVTIERLEEDLRSTNGANV